MRAWNPLKVSTVSLHCQYEKGCQKPLQQPTANLEYVLVDWLLYSSLIIKCNPLDDAGQTQLTRTFVGYPTFNFS